MPTVLTSKYDVGQKLWEIELKMKTELERCPLCDATLFHDKEWKLESTKPSVITDIRFQDGAFYYQVAGAHFREMVGEHEIGTKFFTTRTAAEQAVEEHNLLLMEDRELKSLPFRDKMSKEMFDILVQSVSKRVDARVASGVMQHPIDMLVVELLNTLDQMYGRKKEG